MIRFGPAIACVMFAVAAVSPAAVRAQARQTAPTLREAVPNSFSRPLQCEWRVFANFATHGAALYARNSLSFTLPAGTHLSWSFQRSGDRMPTVGEFDLSSSLHPGNSVMTAGYVPSQPAVAPPSNLQTCTIQASYGVRP